MMNFSNPPDTILAFEILIKLAFLLFMILVICIFDLSDEGRDERETMVRPLHLSN